MFTGVNNAGLIAPRAAKSGEHAAHDLVRILRWIGKDKPQVRVGGTNEECVPFVHTPKARSNAASAFACSNIWSLSSAAPTAERRSLSGMGLALLPAGLF